MVLILQIGLPFDKGVDITPLPESDKPKFLQGLIDDAVEKVHIGDDNDESLMRMRGMVGGGGERMVLVNIFGFVLRGS